MPATRQTTATSDRLSQAILERQAGIFDVMRSVTDRNHRFTRSLIESTRQVRVVINGQTVAPQFRDDSFSRAMA